MVLTSRSAARCARSLTSRGRHMHPRYWRGEWKKGTWLRLLSGMMLRPSQAAHSAHTWANVYADAHSIGSSAEYHASPGVRPVSDLASTIRAIYGMRLVEQLTNSGRDMCLSKMFLGLPRVAADSTEWPRTCLAWIIALQRVSLARRKWARRCSESASSSWQRVTARDHRSTHASEATMAKNSRPLSEMVGLWSRILASDAKRRGVKIEQLKHIQKDLQAFSRLIRPQLATGETFTGLTDSLSPFFCAWLMGLPKPWPIVTMPFAPAEMVSYRSKLRTHLLCLLRRLRSREIQAELF